MADIVRKVGYFSMEVPNKPGERARVLGALADSGVNLPSILRVPQRKEGAARLYS